MDELFAYGLVLGVIAFLSLLGLTTIEERFPSLKTSKLLQFLQNLSVWALIICGLLVIATFLVTYLTQPSAFEKCMEGAKNMIDPQAIAWMEDYCASQQ
jgi:hypothetical protein